MGESTAIGSENATDAAADWYGRYYARVGGDRNDVLRNPEVLFQVLASQASVVRAVGLTDLNPVTAEALDVGCGHGASIVNLLALGFQSGHIHGVDIQPDRVSVARRALPGVDLQQQDARQLAFSDARFDLVMESTMLVQVTDDATASEITSEMIRVTRIGGYLLVVDWRYNKPGHAEYRAVDPSRICKLFRVGQDTAIVGVCRGSLVPPVGRRLSKYLPAAYFLVQAALPFAVGQVATVLRRIA